MATLEYLTVGELLFEGYLKCSAGHSKEKFLVMNFISPYIQTKPQCAGEDGVAYGFEVKKSLGSL